MKFPRSTIHRSKIAPTPELIESGEIIWVTSVQPEPEASHPALRPEVDAGIQAYWRYNGIRKFSSSRPFVKDPKANGGGGGGGAGILTWTDKTTLISK